MYRGGIAAPRADLKSATSANSHTVHRLKFLLFVPSHSMNSLPIELLQQIAANACKDGGQTGCSLSLVSRLIRDATALYRYHSVSLTSCRGIVAFARLTSNQDNLPPGFSIAHLLITVSTPSRIVGDDDRGRGNDYKAQGNNSLPKYITTILHVATPTIKTLFMIAPERLYDIRALFEVAYPLLESVSLPQLLAEPNAHSPTPCFPSLKCLHLSNCPSASRKQLWETLACHAPSLQHVRITLDTAFDRKLPDFLRILFGVSGPARAVPVQSTSRATAAHFPMAPTPGALSVAHTAAQLAELQAVHIQLGNTYGDSHGWCGSNTSILFAYASGLAEIARGSEVRGGSRRVYFLGRRSVPYDDEEARADWLDLIHGGYGPWYSSGDRGDASASGEL